MKGKRKQKVSKSSPASKHKANPIQNPAHHLQYIFRNKIQSIVPNTFSNTESVAQLDSLHNQLKNFPKTNMEPKNGGLEDDFPFQTGDFQVPAVSCWGGY